MYELRTITDGFQGSRLVGTTNEANRPTIICFSHLRWDFVFQRPQHLMTRFAQTSQVIYWEEPLFGGAEAVPRLDIRICGRSGVKIATPVLPTSLASEDYESILSKLLHEVLKGSSKPLTRWYYTPMMLGFSRDLDATCAVYDCMDELANFRFAPKELGELERELFQLADIVFTGGHSLYEAKRGAHANIHVFPSSVEVPHFAKARGDITAPGDQPVGRPNFGFYGVIDERMDLNLLDAIALARPDWNIVMVGPVVKIDPADLPRRANIYYLGARSYDDLPTYLAGWDVALMPFAVNDSTRFISPTKTPEYLAAGKPVVSTPINDVIRLYGQITGVQIASSAADFISACEVALELARSEGRWLAEADTVLSTMSWDETFSRMRALVSCVEHPAKTHSPAVQRRAYDYLIVGAGFAGSVLAERLAAGLGKRVLVIDRRPHIGGNAYDENDATGILMHRYGPHIFHTNSADIVAYLSRFTQWRPYEHRVLARLPSGGLAPMPINRTTLNLLYGLSLKTDEQAAAYLASRAEPVAKIVTSEDVVVSTVGRDLYERFFRGYTRKQWGMDPSELDKSVTSRVPTRTNTDDRYFTDSFQAMPADGYTAMFKAMLDHPGIDVETGLDFEDVRDIITYDHLIFTGRIDEFFDYKFGKLPYRSLTFEHVSLDREQFQPVGTVNYPDESVPYTRISEYKHLTGQVADTTTITYEYPSVEGDPYYPVPRPENQALYKRYEALALTMPNVHFVGRLATYRYYNMDQVVGQALATYRRIVGREGGRTWSVMESGLSAVG